MDFYSLEDEESKNLGAKGVSKFQFPIFEHPLRES